MFEFDAKEDEPSLKEGVSEFTIVSAFDTDSKAGNKMMRIKLDIIDCDGNRGSIDDFFLSKSSWSWKIKELLNSVGRFQWYNKRSFEPSDLIGLNGKCYIGFQEGSQYIKVTKYHEADGNESNPQPKARPVMPKTQEIDDDIPF